MEKRRITQINICLILVLVGSSLKRYQPRQSLVFRRVKKETKIDLGQNYQLKLQNDRQSEKTHELPWYFTLLLNTTRRITAALKISQGNILWPCTWWRTSAMTMWQEKLWMAYLRSLWGLVSGAISWSTTSHRDIGPSDRRLLPYLLNIAHIRALKIWHSFRKFLVLLRLWNLA